MTALLDSIRSHSGRENAAFDDGHYPIGWKETAQAVERTAALIRKSGFGGRPVGLFFDHSTAGSILLVAMIEAGVPIVPLPPFFTDAQRDAFLDHAGAAALITSCVLDGSIVRFAAPSREAALADLPASTAVISFSSGSTGEAKGVCLSAAHLTDIATAVCDHLGRRMAGRHLPILPFGILLEQVAGLFASLIAGGTYCPQPSERLGLANPLRPDGKALLRAIARNSATSLILVPEYLAALVAAIEETGARLPHLDLVAVGGASISPELLARADAVGLPVRQGYGMTEAGSVITLEGPNAFSIGSVGSSIGAHRVTLAKDGEIIIEGPLFLGLVGKPREPGPFRTGDIGRFDEKGCLWIEGRKSNLIVTSLGRNVSPEWIEGLLTARPEIAQAMVRGDGEATLEALIVPAGPAVDIRTAIDRAHEQLPGYARVGTFKVVPPFTPTNGQLTANGRLRRAAINIAHPKERSVVRFFDRLMAETREDQARFAMTPQLIAGLTGQISRVDYIAYLTEAFHHVRHTVPLMQEARAGLVARGDRLLVEALDEYIEEETGHEEWILDDIAAAGGNRDTALLGDPDPATKAMVDHAYRVIRDRNPAAFFGMVFVLEGTSVAMASNGASAVQQRLGLPKSAFRYLNSHGALDQDHMKFFEALMNRIEDPSDQDAIIVMAKDIFRLFGGMFAAIELEGVLDAA
jgi:long-subunit acyl-CoA synthetase (AMP-forming)